MEDVGNAGKADGGGGEDKPKGGRSANEDMVVDGSHIFGDLPNNTFGSGSGENNNNDNICG